MKGTYLILLVLVLGVTGCMNGATKIGNPPDFPSTINQIDGNDPNGNNGAKSVYEGAWTGSELAERNLSIYVAEISSSKVTLYSTGQETPLEATFALDEIGGISALFDNAISLGLVGSVIESTEGTKISVRIYRESQLVAELFKLVSEDILPPDLVDPVAACEASNLKCYDSDAGVLTGYQNKVAGMVVGKGGDGLSCQMTNIDHCDSPGTLIEYFCDNGEIKSAAVECSCDSGRCTDDPRMMKSTKAPTVMLSETSLKDATSVLTTILHGQAGEAVKNHSAPKQATPDFHNIPSNIIK